MAFACATISGSSGPSQRPEHSCPACPAGWMAQTCMHRRSIRCMHINAIQILQSAMLESRMPACGPCRGHLLNT